MKIYTDKELESIRKRAIIEKMGHPILSYDPTIKSTTENLIEQIIFLKNLCDDLHEYIVTNLEEDDPKFIELTDRFYDSIMEGELDENLY